MLRRTIGKFRLIWIIVKEPEIRRGPFSCHEPIHANHTEVKRKMLTRAGLPVEFVAEPSAPDPRPTILICFSHLRWNFVFQRPQHLMCRFSRDMTVIYWEEPIEIGPKDTAFLQVREAEDAPNVRIAVPHLPQGMPEDAREAALKRLLDAHLSALRGRLVAWYYTPMMLPFSRASRRGLHRL